MGEGRGKGRPNYYDSSEKISEDKETPFSFLNDLAKKEQDERGKKERQRANDELYRSLLKRVGKKGNILNRAW